MARDRETRAVEQFTCPTCKAPAGQPCTALNGQRLYSLHGPGCHPLRRKLLSTINQIGIEPGSSADPRPRLAEIRETCERIVKEIGADIRRIDKALDTGSPSGTRGLDARMKRYQAELEALTTEADEIRKRRNPTN